MSHRLEIYFVLPFRLSLYPTAGQRLLRSTSTTWKFVSMIGQSVINTPKSLCHHIFGLPRHCWVFWRIHQVGYVCLWVQHGVPDFIYPLLYNLWCTNKVIDRKSNHKFKFCQIAIRNMYYNNVFFYIRIHNLFLIPGDSVRLYPALHISSQSSTALFQIEG